MTYTEYRSLDWQSQDEVYFDYCEVNDLDSTDPDSRLAFFDTLVEAAQ